MFIVRQAAFTGATGAEQETGSGVPRIVRTGMSTANDTGVMAIAELEVAKGDPADNLRSARSRSNRSPTAHGPTCSPCGCRTGAK